MFDTPLDLNGSNARLSVEIVGPPVIKLDQDIISIRFSLNRAQRNLLEVLVNNWENGSYKYSEGNLLHIGAGINLYSDNVILASGKIISLATNFEDGVPSSLMFTVDAKRIRQRVQKEAISLVYGKDLQEFHHVISTIANSSRLRTYITGTTVGFTDIRPGEVLKINGVGMAFSGSYKVKEVTHTIDGVAGYRTSFTSISSQHLMNKTLGKKPSRVMNEKSKD